jgi:hypothetical protein
VNGVVLMRDHTNLCAALLTLASNQCGSYVCVCVLAVWTKLASKQLHLSAAWGCRPSPACVQQQGLVAVAAAGRVRSRQQGRHAGRRDYSMRVT